MQVIRLCDGVGEEGQSHCVMAATSIVAGESFSDKPECVCPTITRCLISLNDSYGGDNAAREAALSHLPWLIIGTRGDVQVMVRRAFMFADFAVRHVAGIDVEPIVDRDTAKAATRAAAAAARAAATKAAAYAAAYAADAATRAANSADYPYAAAKAADAVAAANSAAKAAAYAANAANYPCAAAAAAKAAAYAANASDWRKRLVDYIESDIIPVHTTMTVEPGFRMDKLVTHEHGAT